MHGNKLNGLNDLYTAISRHEKTVSDLLAFIAAKAFGQTRIESKQANKFISKTTTATKRIKTEDIKCAKQKKKFNV